jgi:HAE1 family hydrophobic/amphiphilic exporter-1
MFMISIVVVLLGIVSLVRLPVDLMPEIDFPALSISVTYEGVGPLEIEELVTRPIEQAVGGVSGLDQVTSTSSDGQSTVQLNFVWGTDLMVAAEDVRTSLDFVGDRLPDDASAPTIFKFDADALPVVFLAVDGDFDPVTLREIAENDVAPRLERVPGVAAVSVTGGQRREIRVELAREKIAALNIAPDDVTNVLRTANQNIPVGEIDEGDTTYLVRSQGQFASLEDIRGLVVTTRDGVPIYVRDIAEVRDTTEDLRSIVRIDGRPGMQMSVTKQSGENTIAVARLVREELARVNREMSGIEVSVLTDTSEFIQSSVASVQQMVLFGAVLVVIVIFTFLRNLRSTLVICSSIPISIIGTFALLYFGGYTLNTLTFGGLALGVGMIVDSAIVVLENTYRHMEKGEDRVTAAVNGSEEVWSAIVASSLTQVAVFVPLLFLTGIASIMFGSLAIVVIFSLSVSLFVAVTLVPVLCSRLLRVPKPNEHPGATGRFVAASGRVLDALDDGYRRLLHRALSHRAVVVVVAGALFVASLAALPLVGFELAPAADEGQVRVTADLPVGTRIERSADALLRIEQLVERSVPEAQSVMAQTGSLSSFGPGGGTADRLNVTIDLGSREERARSSEEVTRALRRDLVGIPGVIARARAAGDQFNINRAIGGGQNQISVEIRGHDLADQARLANEIRTLMEATPGVIDVTLEAERGRPEIGITTDVRRAALWGLSVTDVANALRTSVGGTQAAFYRERGEEYPIVVRMQESDRLSLAHVGELLVHAGEGQLLPVKDLIEVRPQTGPVEIRRRDQERVTRVTAEVETVVSEAIRLVGAQLETLDVPADFSVGFGQEVEEQNETFLQILLVLLLAVVLVYAVMASQFESLKDPFIIMFSIPLAVIGVVGALLVTGTPFSLPAGIGIVLLAGLVVNNAILLVDYTNTLRRRDGLPLFDAIEIAGRTRLRPILMTSVTTMLGLVPMALGFGEGSEMQAPLARVVIGGLATSTLITLIVVPTVYSLFEGGWHRGGTVDGGPLSPAA